MPGVFQLIRQGFQHSLPAGYSPDLQRLASWMLQSKPCNRPTADLLLRDAWLQPLVQAYYGRHLEAQLQAAAAAAAAQPGDEAWVHPDDWLQAAAAATGAQPGGGAWVHPEAQLQAAAAAAALAAAAAQRGGGSTACTSLPPPCADAVGGALLLHGASGAPSLEAWVPGLAGECEAQLACMEGGV